MTHLAEKLLCTLPSWRKVTGPNQLMSWQQFVADVQEQINPLVSEEDLRQLALQLHSMGEVCVQYYMKYHTHKKTTHRAAFIRNTYLVAQVVDLVPYEAPHKIRAKRADF